MFLGIICSVVLIVFLKSLAICLRYVFEQGGLFAGIVACGVVLKTSFMIAKAMDERDGLSQEEQHPEQHYLPKERQE